MRRLRLANLPAEGWTRIDVAALWPDTLLPLIECTPDLQCTLETAVKMWIDSFDPDRWPQQQHWRWADEAATAPFLLSDDDDEVVTIVEGRVRSAAERLDPEALAYLALKMLVSDSADPGLPEDVMHRLQDRAFQLWLTFAPRRDEVLWVRPEGSCHCFDEFQLALARAWRPDVDWQIVGNRRYHSTVVGLDERLIFDLVLLANDDDTDPNEPVLFAKGTGKVLASIRERNRQTRNAQARLWRRATANVVRVASKEPGSQPG